MTKNAYEPPAGPPPGWRGPASSNAGTTGQDSDYAPPPGPPPSHRSAAYGSSQEPLPSSTSDQPPAYEPHNWQEAVPDTSLLPPPPLISYDYSPTANASYELAQQAVQYCQSRPIAPARRVDQAEVSRIQRHQYGAIQPPRFGGRVTVYSKSDGHAYHVQSSKQEQDCCVISELPIYSALLDHSAASTTSGKTIYYEVKIRQMGGYTRPKPGEEIDGAIAIGFAAVPYPTFRLPGWNRGSLGVHGDDGRRFVNNDEGGKDFTTTFRDGDVVGIGMTLRHVGSSKARPTINVFFTRNGSREGNWDLHEERDSSEKGDVFGLEGGHDLYAAVGLFGGNDFVILYDQKDWQYDP